MAYRDALAGDNPDVTTLYAHRTAATHAAYLLPHLQPQMHILDVGSGPGGITRDLARLVPHGRVVGIDASPGIVAQARKRYLEDDADPPPNLSYEVGDAHELAQFADGSFDVVHAHAVLMHVPHPITALRAMRRVVKTPGGIVATRDPVGPSTTTLTPLRPPYTRLLTEALPAHAAFINSLGSDMSAGLRKTDWAREVGFDPAKMVVDRSGDCVDWDWSIFRGAVRKRAVEMGVVTEDQLEEWAGIMREWLKEPERELRREFVDVLCFT